MHVECAEERLFTVLDEARMHRPLRVFGVGRDIHDDLAEAAADARFGHGVAEAVEAIAVGELTSIRNGKCEVRSGMPTMLSRKVVVPVNNISAMLSLAAAYPSSEVKLP
jgi:hypothetical protein